VLDWIRNRGGIAIWPSENLGNPDASWTTPVLTADGQPKFRPSWEASDEPIRIITSTDDVLVSEDAEVRRFPVTVRRAGFSLKLTAGSINRLRRAVANAGKGAYHRFGYSTQEAVIFAPQKASITLTEWAARQEAKSA
jgi:hypothetical protein